MSHKEPRPPPNRPPRQPGVGKPEPPPAPPSLYGLLGKLDSGVRAMRDAMAHVIAREVDDAMMEVHGTAAKPDPPPNQEIRDGCLYPQPVTEPPPAPPAPPPPPATVIEVWRIAVAETVEEQRQQIERLEKRVDKLERAEP